jgi:hypothetical protein
MFISDGDTNETCKFSKEKKSFYYGGGGALTSHIKFIASDVDKHKIKT